MAVENFIYQARQELKGRAHERLVRQITDITSWANSRDSFSQEDKRSLSARAEIVSRTAEEIDALDSLLLVTQEGKNEQVEGEFRGSWVILRRQEGGEKSTFSAAQNSEDLSPECAEKAWYLYGQPVSSAYSHAKLLDSKSKK